MTTTERMLERIAQALEAIAKSLASIDATLEDARDAADVAASRVIVAEDGRDL